MPHAFAIVKVKVACRSNWSPETTIAQITKQATEGALGQLRQVFDGRDDMAIHGDPVITMVHAELDKAKGA